MTVSGALAGIAALREARDAPSRACRWSLAGPNSVTPRFSVSLPVSKHGAAGSSTQGPGVRGQRASFSAPGGVLPSKRKGMGTSAGERMDRRWGGGSRRPPCAARGRMRRAMRSRGGRCGERRPARRLAARARRSACGSVGSGTQGGSGGLSGDMGAVACTWQTGILSAARVRSGDGKIAIVTLSATPGPEEGLPGRLNSDKPVAQTCFATPWTPVREERGWQGPDAAMGPGAPAVLCQAPVFRRLRRVRHDRAPSPPFP